MANPSVHLIHDAVIETFQNRKYSTFEVLYSYLEYLYIMTIGKYFNTRGYQDYMIAWEIYQDYKKRS